MTKNPAVDTYIAKSAEFARPILAHLRALVHRGCPGCTETIKWSFPHFEYAGQILCSMAAFKAHAAFHFWHRDMQDLLRKEGIHDDSAMGSFGRITRRADLPSDAALLRLIRTAAKVNESGAPGNPRPVRKPRSEAKVPADLAAALRKNKTAATTFAEFSPSHRREYIEWIVDAKREETRAKRLATTLAWLEAGKPRHWKYVKC